MAKTTGKVVFITTSPRTPMKMIPEIALLGEHFTGMKWDKDNQIKFMTYLKEEDFFRGVGVNDPAFSARDRINRAPKSLGFVTLSPVIELTRAGQALVSASRTEEIFLRQLLKFQLPSPFHTESHEGADFCVKPYLEMFRLVSHLGTLKFDELRLFGLQLVNHNYFDEIVNKITRFREAKVKARGGYKAFFKNYAEKELRSVYEDEILAGKTKTRQSKDASTENFLETKWSNMRDYADACVRYLRATGMVNISHVGKSLSIAPEKAGEVEFFLKNVSRVPCFVNDEAKYTEYLGDPAQPSLLTDDRDLLVGKLKNEFPKVSFNINSEIEVLKELLDGEVENRKKSILRQEVVNIKDYRKFNDITDVFADILKNKLYDAPLLLEWNTWRAMTMLNGGDIQANLKFDDFGHPMSTAQGNMADIVCDYGDFGLTVEVTMQKGTRQYETEGEPVARHLAKLKKSSGKPAYCLFLAPEINESCIAHFYFLHKTNIQYYGGTSTIIPLPISIFQKMVDDSFRADSHPSPSHVKRFFERSNQIAVSAGSEVEWYEGIKKHAIAGWLS